MTETSTTPTPPTIGELVSASTSPATGIQLTQIRQGLVRLKSEYGAMMRRNLDLPSLTNVAADELYGHILDARDAVRKIQ